MTSSILVKRMLLKRRQNVRRHKVFYKGHIYGSDILYFHPPFCLEDDDISLPGWFVSNLTGGRQAANQLVWGRCCHILRFVNNDVPCGVHSVVRAREMGIQVIINTCHPRLYWFLKFYPWVEVEVGQGRMKVRWFIHWYWN